MPGITLKRADAIRLLEFCQKNNKPTFFMAKDHGAYVGQSNGAADNCIFYFKGCNPKTDADWWGTTDAQFGGNDFGEFLPVAWLETVANNPHCRAIRINVNAKRITATYPVTA
jgi:hypothetical protein